MSNDQESENSSNRADSFLRYVKSHNIKQYRTILDPVAHYVFAHKGAESNLLSFVNSVFDDKQKPLLKRLTVLNPFDAKTFPSEKQAIVDILAEDELQRKITIEFQIWNHVYFIERCVYYWSRTYLRQLSDGDEYPELNPVVSIVLTDFPVWRHMRTISTTLEDTIHLSSAMRINEDPMVILTDHFEMHFLQLPKVINATTLAGIRPGLADWLTYFGYPDKTTEADMENVAINNPNVEAALNSYRTFHESPELRAVAEYSERFRREAAAYADTREQLGRAEGKIEDLILILTKRFGLLSKDLTAKITGMTDLADINRLIDIALDVPSLTEFTNQMK